jgi:hypothetical protein
MSLLPDRRRSIRTIKKFWNTSALIASIFGIALMVAAVFSIQDKPTKTGDYLQLQNPQHHSIVQQDKAQLGLLRRDIDIVPKPGDAATPSEDDNEPFKVKIGFYASNNYNITPQVPSFDSTGYAWFIWQDDLQDYLTKNNLNIWEVMTPINLLSLPNGAGSVFAPTTGSDKPIRMKDGSWYLTSSYKGTFYVDRSDFRYHPFTRLSLPIMVEPDDILLSHNKLQIIPDAAGSGVGQFIDASKGWVNTGWAINAYKHHYDTDFSFGEGASDYSQLVYEIQYSTDSWLAFWKILVPIFIVMAMIVGATKIDPTHYDVRLTMPVTVLLTLVFLQQSHNSDLPRLSYMTFLDEVYVICYVITLISFVLMLWACRRYYAALKIEDPQLQALEMHRLDKSDNYWPTFVILAAIISISISWLIT